MEQEIKQGRTAQGGGQGQCQIPAERVQRQDLERLHVLWSLHAFLQPATLTLPSASLFPALPSSRRSNAKLKGLKRIIYLLLMPYEILTYSSPRAPWPS